MTVLRSWAPVCGDLEELLDRPCLAVPEREAARLLGAGVHSQQVTFEEDRRPEEFGAFAEGGRAKRVDVLFDTRAECV